MKKTKPQENSFPYALREARKALNMTQEDFDLVSSRTYVSSLERGLKTPTLRKVDELAEVMNIHPLTLLTLSYMEEGQPKSAASLQAVVSRQLDEIFKEHG